MSIDADPVTTFVLDEIPYSTDQLGENWRESFPHGVVTADGLDEGKVFGFSTEAGMEAWILRGSYRAEYEHLNALEARVRRPADAQEEASIIARQISDAERASERFLARLAREGISPDDANAVANLIANYDPLLGPPGSCIWLYNGFHFAGYMTELLYGRVYLDLGQYGGLASSLMATSSGFLYAGPNLQWPRLPVLVRNGQLRQIPNLSNVIPAFNNRARSATVG